MEWTTETKFNLFQRKLTLKGLFSSIWCREKVAQQISKKRNKNLNTNREQIVEKLIVDIKRGRNDQLRQGFLKF